VSILSLHTEYTVSIIHKSLFEVHARLYTNNSTFPGLTTQFCNFFRYCVQCVKNSPPRSRGKGMWPNQHHFALRWAYKT